MISYVTSMYDMNNVWYGSDYQGELWVDNMPTNINGFICAVKEETDNSGPCLTQKPSSLPTISPTVKPDISHIEIGWSYEYDGFISRITPNHRSVLGDGFKFHFPNIQKVIIKTFTLHDLWVVLEGFDLKKEDLTDKKVLRCLELSLGMGVSDLNQKEQVQLDSLIATIIIVIFYNTTIKNFP